MIRVKYINHSGFLVETPTAVYVFDYYRGELGDFDISKPVTVFSSHVHADHFNPDIFSILKSQGVTNLTAVLSDDIPKEKYPSFAKTVPVSGANIYALPGGEKLHTLFSTDEGVAFLLETGDGVFFHAGDLNDWRWEGESDRYNREMVSKFRTEIDKLKNIHIDCAFFPLDPRQEKYTGEGLLYFLENIKVSNVYPMHYWNEPKTIGEFSDKHPDFINVIRNTEKL